MKIFSRTLLILILNAIIFSTYVVAAQNQRVALVIGNSAYKTGPLKNPVNDAIDMAKLLEEMGFEVIRELNASKRQIEEAINSLGRKLGNGGVGLFYFAGHGVQVRGMNYLIPVDANIETQGDVQYEAVNANRILSKMQDAGNPLNFVFLDACRNNPFSSRFRSVQKGLAPMDAPKGSLIAFATAPGEVADDGSGRNGVFTKHLLKQMQGPSEIGPMMRKVRAGVQADTDGKQTPFEISSLTGNFFFDSEAAPKPEKPKSYLQLAAIDPEIFRSRISDKDGRFIKYDTGVVEDLKTGLEWYPGPDEDMSWEEAKVWVENLNVDGGGWRMPSRKKEELEGLYEKGLGSRNMTPLLETTGWFVWSKEKKSSSHPWLYDFNEGKENYSIITGSPWDNAGCRAFGVRSR